MNETTGLPPSPTWGRGMNFLMTFGLMMCIAAFIIAVMASSGELPMVDHPYWIAAALLLAGATGFRYGSALVRE